MNEVCQDVKVYINDKGYRATALTTYKMSFYADTTNHAKPLSAGDKVYVYTTFKDGKIVGSEISNRNNTKYIIIVIALFIITVVIVGGVKGIKSLIGLIFTIAAIFYLLIPGIMNGKDPLMLTILVSTLVIIVTLIIIAGFNRKSYAAMIGTVGGIIVSGLFAILFGNLMNMTGMCEETGLLVGLSDEAKAFDYRGILFSGIIIGALGACMDVGMSLASALQELKQETYNSDIYEHNTKSKYKGQKALPSYYDDAIKALKTDPVLKKYHKEIIEQLIQITFMKC